MLNLILATAEELCQQLGQRLRARRMQRLLTQDELAARAGIAVGTVRKLESSGQSSMDSVMRVVLVLGLADELQGLFVPQVLSIAQMESAESAQLVHGAQRQRAPRRQRA